MSEISYTKLGLSLASWIFMYIGLIALRAETHHWVNTLLLTAVYPMYIWYMSKNNIVGIISPGSMYALVIGSTLFMTLLLEAWPNSKFSTDLKRFIKEYGKNPKDTAMASIAIAVSIGVGAFVSYLVTKQSFIEY